MMSSNDQPDQSKQSQLNDDGSSNPHELSQADQKLVDSIFEYGVGSRKVSAENDLREQAVLGLFSLIDTPVEAEFDRQSRVDLITILASKLEQTDSEHDLQLSDEDQQALDHYVNSGYQDSVSTTVHEGRVNKIDSIGALLTSGQQYMAQKEDLVLKTLAHTQSYIDAQEQSMKIEDRRRFSIPVRWADVVSIAAMLLIVGSIALPIMDSMRSNAQKNICFDNMHATANAFGLYAGSNQDMLPMATAGLGSTWMDVGSAPERSNSSNLFTLIRSGMIGLDDLACPTNKYAATGEAAPNAWDWNSLQEVSYSYRIMPPGGMRVTIEQPSKIVIMSDRSPVVLRIKQKVPVIPEENSPNHSGRGQHMLMLDGSAIWKTNPILDNGDNVWLPRPIEKVIHEARSKLGIVKGTELPDGPTDAFVGP